MLGGLSLFSRSGIRSTVAVVGVLALGFVGQQQMFATAQHQPADKTSASGSAAEVVGPGQNVTILTQQIRTAAPTDLILGVTAECAILTALKTVGDDTASAFGEVELSVWVDGKVVPVSLDDAAEPDAGKVTFCNRAHQRSTSNFDDTDATIQDSIDEMQANAFNWLALNVGNGIHTIEVRANLTETAVSGKSDAQAVVGKRTLIIEPVKAANDEVVDLGAQ